MFLRRGSGTSLRVVVPELFDRSARRLRRARYLDRPAGFFEEAFAEILLDRLGLVTRAFERVAVIGANRPLLTALRARGVEPYVVEPSAARAAATGAELVCDEDLADLPAGGFDLVLAAGTLDSVSDLPGTLVQARRALSPDGLFLGVAFCAPSLAALRALFAAAGTSAEHATLRFHPLVDPRSGGDLLVRAGFALPVADIETFRLAYRSFARLRQDLSEAAASNVLQHRPMVPPPVYRALREGFVQATSAGPFVETFTVLVLTGWSPSETQPQPARRGSGAVSLAQALKPGDAAGQ